MLYNNLGEQTSWQSKSNFKKGQLYIQQNGGGKIKVSKIKHLTCLVY
jgi:hypothetical protein